MNVDFNDDQRIVVTDAELLYDVMYEILIREEHYEMGHEHF